MAPALPDGMPLPPDQLNGTACAAASADEAPMPGVNDITIERHDPSIAVDLVAHDTPLSLPIDVAMDHGPAKARCPPPETVGPHTPEPEPLPVNPNLEPLNPAPAIPDPAHLQQGVQDMEAFEYIDPPQWPHHTVANGAPLEGEADNFRGLRELLKPKVFGPMMVAFGIGVVQIALEKQGRRSSEVIPEVCEDWETQGHGHLEEAE
ncbi:hypothetical protein LTR49_027289 [Elasticomyces elasticus]|nr:hypothetical protein LTR49_027289 [Elasticomyces elasticus]KAK5737394.1 hypothetical protein LTS12_025910 [Elasticomyces elasticus]